MPTPPPQAGDDLSPARVGRLPLKIEQLADVAPTTIRLAAAGNIESDAVPTLPAVTVDTPAMPEVIAVEAEREHAGTRYSSRAHNAAKAKLRSYRAASDKSTSSKAKVVEKVPRWAQQMFETPWQTKAFSYYD